MEDSKHPDTHTNMIALHLIRGLVACGIFTTVAVVSEGYFFTALHESTIDCKVGSTHNADTCAVDIIEGVVAGLATFLAGGAAIISAGILPRDAANYDPFDLASVDGKALHKWEVFNRDWMRENLREGERTFISHNISRMEGASKLMTEAWKEDGKIKLTQYAQAGGLGKRSKLAYLHFAGEESDIGREDPNFKTSYVYARDAAQHIFDDMANRHARSNCISFQVRPKADGGILTAYFGLEGSYEYTNDAPGYCDYAQGYTQIGDLHLTGA